MAEEQKPQDIEAMKKELADIKNEMMRKELEEIKREKMREELEALKAEQAQKGPRQQYAPYKPVLSIPMTILAILTLVAAGYLFGTLYTYDLAGSIDKLVAGYPITGAMVVAVAGIALVFIGLGFVAMAKK